MEKDFFELLINNNKEEIKKFVIENGKEGKPFCPLLFEKENKGENHDS